jgi:hypothetical protein
MSAQHRIPDPAAIACWLHTLKIHARGCISRSRIPQTRSLSPPATRRAASSPSRPRPKPVPNPNRRTDERDGRDEYSQ